MISISPKKGIAELGRRVWAFVAPVTIRPRPTSRDQVLIDALRLEMPSLSASDKNQASLADQEWMNNQERLRSLVLTRDPRLFLTWDVLNKTMFVALVLSTRHELRYLKSTPDWASRWRQALRESSIGAPMPCPFYPQSSGNLIVHAYHVARFEEFTGLRISTFDLIVEFGAGYGSMCRLAHALGFAGLYVALDLPLFGALQRYFLASLGLPLIPEEQVSARHKGIVTTSDLDLLERLPQSDRALFIATWSLSETPLNLRARILPFLSHFSAFLIGYQPEFGGVDNIEYFNALQRALPNIAWVEVTRTHSSGVNRYLFGSRKK
jgi:hypothetical protein